MTGLYPFVCPGDTRGSININFTLMHTLLVNGRLEFSWTPPRETTTYQGVFPVIPVLLPDSDHSAGPKGKSPKKSGAPKPTSRRETRGTSLDETVTTGSFGERNVPMLW